jgi:hypothetical protein
MPPHLRRADRYGFRLGQVSRERVNENVLAALRERGLIGNAASQYRSWIDEVSQPAVAHWAYNSAAEMTHWLYSKVPFGIFQMKMTFIMENIPSTRAG